MPDAVAAPSRFRFPGRPNWSLPVTASTTSDEPARVELPARLTFTASTEPRGGTLMGSLSIWHWVVVIVFIASPVMGIVRGVKNGSLLNSLLSVFFPIYGLVYFFAGR